MKPISSRAHGIVDYLTVVLFALAPTLFGLTGTAATLAYALAAVHLVMTVITAFPMGIVRVVPFRVHGIVELLVAITLMGIGMFNFGTDTTAGLFSARRAGHPRGVGAVELSRGGPAGHGVSVTGERAGRPRRDQQAVRASAAAAWTSCFGCGARVPDVQGPTHRYMASTPGCWAT